MSARTPEETHAAIEAALNAGDLDAFVEAYDEEAALIVPPDGRRVSGREAIRDAMQDTFELHPKAKIEVLEKLEADGLALTQACWSVDGTDDEGEPVRLAGEGTIVSRRQADGGWRIVLDIPVRAQ